MENLEYFIALIVVFVIGVILIKKITGCIFRIIVGLIMLGVGYWALRMLEIL